MLFFTYFQLFSFLDPWSDWTYQVPGDATWSHWVARVQVLPFWIRCQKFKIIPCWRSCIFMYFVFHRYILFPYSHFPLISITFMGCFSNLKINFLRVRHKSIYKWQTWCWPWKIQELRRQGPALRNNTIRRESHTRFSSYKGTFFSYLSDFHENEISLNRFYPSSSSLFTLPLERWNNLNDW